MIGAALLLMAPMLTTGATAAELSYPRTRPVIATNSLSAAHFGGVYNARVRVRDGRAGTWKFAGLPPGLTGRATGLIAGKPTFVGTKSVTVTFTDRLKRKVSKHLNLSVLVSPRIAVGANHSCVLLPSGQVKCWGSNRFGQMGVTTNYQSVTANPAPLLVTGISGAIALAAGYSHTCALIYDGTVRCWGDNSQGALGNGQTSGGSQTTATTVLGVGGTGVLDGVVAIDAGYQTNCAVLADRSVACWGSNNHGLLGGGSSNPGWSATPQAIPGVSATSVSVGYAHACAVAAAGTAMCWGNDGEAELGDGTAGALAKAPVAVTGMNDVVAIEAGGDEFTCALHKNSTVTCWGYNDSGVVGSASNISSSVPSPNMVSNLPPVAAISAGFTHMCAQLINGSVACWGDDAADQLGYGRGPSSAVPSPVTPVGLLPGLGVDTGPQSQHTCQLRGDGSVWCWGYDAYGQTGDSPHVGGYTAIPTKVAGL